MDKEEENEFLTSVDLEAVNATDKVDKVTVEKVDKRTEGNKNIFDRLSLNFIIIEVPVLFCCFLFFFFIRT